MPMRWLPVDAALGDKTANALVPVLADTARSARHLKWWTIGTVTGSVVGALFTAALAANGYPWAGVPLATLPVLAYGRAQQTDLLQSGKAGFWTRGARIPPEPQLPEPAAKLLHDLRQGHRKARIRRGDEGPWLSLYAHQLRGPFGALLLSPHTEQQALALRAWYGGDGLAVEVEVPMEEPPVPARDAVAAETVSRFNWVLMIERERLDQLLAAVYPLGLLPGDRAPRKDRLIVRTLQIAHECRLSGMFETPGKLRVEVKKRLEAEGIDIFTLTDNSEKPDDSWMEKLLQPAGYGPIDRKLRAAAGKPPRD